MTPNVTDLWNSSHEVSRRWRGLVGVEDGVWNGSDAGHPLHVLAGEVSLTLLLPLGQSHVQRFGGDDAAVHFCHGLRGLFRRREAHKPEAFASAALHHNLNKTQKDVSEEKSILKC